MDRLFARFANATAKATGTPLAFLLCVALVLAWAVTGPVFKFSETWQLVINTGTTIVTFLMVFLIQNTQNRDGAAVQAKLDQLILSSDAEDRFIGIEKMTEKELRALHDECAARARAHLDAQDKIKRELGERRRRSGGRTSAAKPQAPKGRAKRSRARTGGAARG